MLIHFKALSLYYVLFLWYIYMKQNVNVTCTYISLTHLEILKFKCLNWKYYKRLQYINIYIMIIDMLQTLYLMNISEKNPFNFILFGG